MRKVWYVSSNLISKLLRFHCAHPIVHVLWFNVTITCASSSGFRDCLQTMTTLCQISTGLKRLMRRACLVRRASLRTLGNMFQTMALTRRSSSSQMNRKMSLKVESSENVKWRDVIWVFTSFLQIGSRQCLWRPTVLCRKGTVKCP